MNDIAVPQAEMFKDIISSLPYPPFLPDATPCDYHIFGPFEEAFGGMIFWTSGPMRKCRK
jgi:hypothetical protein